MFAPKKLLRENQGTVARAKNIPTALHKRSSLLGTSTVARLTPPVEGNVAIFDHVSVNWSEKRAGIKKKQLTVIAFSWSIQTRRRSTSRGLANTLGHRTRTKMS